MKNLPFSSISVTFINSSLYYSKALCKPYYCVPFTWSFCSLHLSFTATLSSIFSHRLCPVSLILYFSSAKTSHIHLSKLNNGGGSPWWEGHSCRSVHHPKQFLWSVHRLAQEDLLVLLSAGGFSAVPVLKQGRAWHDCHGQAMLCYCTHLSKTGSAPLQTQG